MTGLLIVALMLGATIYLLRRDQTLDPVPVQMARSAATTGRLGDVAIVVQSSTGSTMVTCSCDAQEILYSGTPDDCRLYAVAYNAEVRRLWEGAISDDT